MSYLKQHQKEAESKGMILIPRYEMNIAQHIRECETLDEATEYLYGVLVNIKIGIRKTNAEPAAFMFIDSNGNKVDCHIEPKQHYESEYKGGGKDIPLYDHPPQTKELSFEGILECLREVGFPVEVLSDWSKEKIRLFAYLILKKANEK